ncbi:MAG: YdcF family protein [Blautia sp.]|nr:YdcF family protein [Blautia sp.]
MNIVEEQKMKYANAVNQTRKQLLFLVFVLSMFCLTIILCGRAMNRNHFRMTQPLDAGHIPPDPADMQIRWEGGEMQVDAMAMEVMEDGSRIMLEVHPETPGDYVLDVTDRSGETLYYDELHVGPMGFTYSSETGNFTGDTAVFGGITLFFIGMAVLHIWHFFRLKGPLMYTYDAIFACGIGLFCTVTGLNMLNLFIRRLTFMEFFWMRDVYEALSLAGSTFVILTSPLILLFSVLMIISNIALLRHESFRIQNVLGLGISLILILSELFGAWLIISVSDMADTRQEMQIIFVVQSVYFTIFTYLECILMGAVICGIRAARHVPAPDKDYILILGCWFKKDGTLPPLLRGRVDKAVEFWKKQFEQTGKKAVLIPTGGQGKSESMAEAEAMTRYLTGTGFDAEYILKEDQARNTYQNMEYSYKLIREREPDVDVDEKKILFVTTNYHVFRSGVWAGLAGVPAEGLGSPTKWWFWPNAFMRECVGLFVNRIRLEILWLGILVAVFAGLAMMVR